MGSAWCAELGREVRKWCIIRWREKDPGDPIGFRELGCLYAFKASGKGEGERRISIRYLSKVMQNTLL